MHQSVRGRCVYHRCPKYGMCRHDRKYHHSYTEDDPGMFGITVDKSYIPEEAKHE